MRIFFLGFCLVFLSIPATAQRRIKERIKNKETVDKQIYTWGYYIGFNNYDYKFDYNEIPVKEIETIKTLGFNVGLVGDVRLNEYMNFRLEPGIIFAERKLIFTDPTFTTVSQQEREVASTYIHVPALLEISTKRVNNFKPFIIGGVSWDRNLSSNEENPDDNSFGQFRQKTNVFNYELGLGVDLYLPYFKFTPSIRGVFALNDELQRDIDPNSLYTGNITSMQSRGIFLHFTVQ